jgi:Ca2+-binding RTX toxin-like protein
VSFLARPRSLTIDAATYAESARFTGKRPRRRISMRRTRIITTLVAVGTLGMVLAAVAMAATIIGTDDGERLRGTNNGDTISGNGGRDKIQALAGDDIVSGGTGGDRIWAGRGVDNVTGDSGWDLIVGGPGNDATLNGGDGPDRIAGGRGNDTSSGGNGNDRIFANVGVDSSDGGAGNDDLWALARGDVNKDVQLDTTGDSLTGGEGDDRFHTRDGEQDTVDCGPGNDVAILDTVDVIAGATVENPNGTCEDVRRAAPNSKDRKRGRSQDHDRGSQD